MYDLQLVSHHLCPYVQRAVITLTEKEIKHERTYIDLADKPKWFRDISPLGRVPVLRAGGAVLFESSVICEYLDEITPGSLHPSDPMGRALHRAWSELASATLDAIAGLYGAHDMETFRTKASVLRDRLTWLDRQLAEGPYFAGETFHLVDAAWAPVFRYFDILDAVTGLEVLKGLERVNAYRRTLSQRESVRTAVPADYSERLRTFLLRRDSYLARTMAESA